MNKHLNLNIPSLQQAPFYPFLTYYPIATKGSQRKWRYYKGENIFILTKSLTHKIKSTIRFLIINFLHSSEVNNIESDIFTSAQNTWYCWPLVILFKEIFKPAHRAHIIPQPGIPWLATVGCLMPWSWYCHFKASHGWQCHPPKEFLKIL